MSPLKEVTIAVSGMHCPSCARAVENGIKAKEGVERVSVDVSAGTVRVSFDGGKVSLNDIETAIEDSGYDVVKTKG